MHEFVESVVPTKYWHKLEDGRVQCDLCPRFCRLREGQRGMCFVRMCQDEQVVLTTYGRSSGFCVDPIEKKPLNHFLPGTPILSFGTAGCNLACKFCQNWDISKSREMDRLADTASPEGLAEAAAVKTVAVTAGYVCDEPRREFYRYMDAANVDLKAFTDDFYWKLTKSHLEPVLETLVYLKHETDVWFELTTLLIPGNNDSDAELDELTRWVVEHLGPDVPMHFTAFHPDWKMTDVPPTPPATLARAREIAVRNGVRYPYTGNVHDLEGGSTICHKCGHTLVARDWYILEAWQLTDDGCCGKCGEPCAGVFDGPPGDWGARRLPVRIGS
jgi:pyruvate formate lyase activating enzyme